MIIIACNFPNVQCNAPNSNTNICVPMALKCDGKYQCKDGEDERDCSASTCQPREWSCSDGQCIPINKKCDNIEDCEDGSDEIMDCGNYILDV